MCGPHMWSSHVWSHMWSHVWTLAAPISRSVEKNTPIAWCGHGFPCLAILICKGQNMEDSSHRVVARLLLRKIQVKALVWQPVHSECVGFLICKMGILKGWRWCLQWLVEGKRREPKTSQQKGWILSRNLASTGCWGSGSLKRWRRVHTGPVTQSVSSLHSPVASPTSQKTSLLNSSVQSLSRVRLCDPMDRSTPGLPVVVTKSRNNLQRFTKTTLDEGPIYWKSLIKTSEVSSHSCIHLSHHGKWKEVSINFLKKI